MDALIFGILGVIMIIALGAILAKKAAGGKSMEVKKLEAEGRYPKGHYTGIGMAMGIALGFPIGIAMDIPSLGVSFGLPIGLVIGMALDKKLNPNPRPLTPQEEKTKKKTILIAIGTLILGMILLAAIFLLN